MNFLNLIKPSHWLLIALPLLGLSACEKFELCEEENNTFVLQYYKDKKAENIFLNNFIIEGTVTIFLVEDSVIGGSFLMPLAPTDTLISFIISRNEASGEVKDTLSFSYTVRDSVQSTDCGVIHYYKNLELEYASIEADSIIVKNPEDQQEENQTTNEKIVTIYRSSVAAD